MISLLRWGYQLVRFFTAPPVSPLLKAGSPAQEIDRSALEEWVHTMSSDGESADGDDDTDER